MPKKSFKDKTEHLDRFFSTPEGEGTHRTPDEPKQAGKYYRLNLKLKYEYKDYLTNASWAAHKSITQYINDLIEADKDTRDI